MKTIYELMSSKKILKVTDSFEYEYFMKHRTLLEGKTFLKKYDNNIDDFKLISNVIILQSLESKKLIEESLVEGGEKVPTTLPFLSIGNQKILIPFFSVSLNLIYDAKKESLRKYPYLELTKDFESSYINPFDYYGYQIYDSSFSRMIFLQSSKSSAAFYHPDFETIYIINDQGTLDLKIPLFDKYLPYFDKENLYPRLLKVMAPFYENRLFDFIEELLKNNLISEKLFGMVMQLVSEHEQKSLKMMQKGKAPHDIL